MQRDRDTHGTHATGTQRTALAFCLTVLLALGTASAARGQTEAVMVTSFTNGDIVVVTLQPAEGGGYTRDGEPFAGGLVTLENGSAYLVTLATDGTWTAAYQQVSLPVPLNAMESVTLTRLEDGTFALPDGEPVTLATRYTTASGRTYGVEIGADGMPRPVYVPLRVTVPLGTRGSVELARGEDLTWAIGDRAVASGDYHEGRENALTGEANRYQLTLDDGRWTATYEAAEVAIAGTDLVARPREDGRGYQVGEATLSASGRGDLTFAAPGGMDMYHVWATEDGLAGARFDKRIEGAVYTANVVGTAGAPSLSADNRATAANELRTQVKLAGSDFELGELLDGGRATEEPERTLLEQVRTELGKLRAQVQGLVDLRNNDGIDQLTLSSQLVRKWNEADRQVDRLFGAADENDDNEPDNRLERVLSATRVLGAFDGLLEALETEDAFVEATAASEGGVYAFAGLGEAAAVRAFSAREWSAEAVFGALGETRYGAVVRKERATAPAASAATRNVQAFAWATTGSPWQASDVEVSGNAYYSGSTLAADKEGALYSGEIALQVRFTRQRVSGVVSNLMTEDGERWSKGLGGDVVNIALPSATMNTRGQWTGRGEARLSYERRAGGSRDIMLGGAAFQGRLLGTGSDAGGQAVGTWQLGDGNQEDVLIAGGFGAVRGPDRADPTQPLLDDVTTTGATVTRLARTAAAGSDFGVLAEEQLRVDGSRFKTLADDSVEYASGAEGLAEARAAVRTASDPVALSDADADRIIRVGAEITGDGALTATTFTGWTVDAAGAQRAFDEAVKSSARTARTWFIEDSTTLRIWPLVAGLPTNPATGGRFAVHPVAGSGTQDPRLISSVAYDYLKLNLDIGTLFGEGYAVPETTDELTNQATDLFVPSGSTHVERARKELTRLQRVLRSVIALDSADASAADRKFTNDRRQSLFTQIQEQLTGEIFGGTVAELGVFGSRASQARGEHDLWTDHADYPVNTAGQPQDAQLLGDIDATIAALSSQRALEGAFRSGGIFAGKNAARTFSSSSYGEPRVTSLTITADNIDDVVTTFQDDYLTGLADPFTLDEVKETYHGSRVVRVESSEFTLPISHIWTKARARALLVTDSTDFTRFGMWSGQHSDFAMKTGGQAGIGGFRSFYDRTADPEPFAYSPLDQVAYRGVDDPATPAGVQATYRGRSVAVMSEDFMTADATARVSWSEVWSADTDPKIGELKLTISNIESRGKWGGLRFGLRDYRSETTGDFEEPRPGTYDVRELVFRSNIRVDSDQDNAVVFANDGAGQENVEVVIDSLTGQPQWLAPEDLEIKLLDDAGEPNGKLLFDNTGNAFSVSNDPANEITRSAIEVASYYNEVGNPFRAFNWPGHAVREAFDHYYSQGAGAGKMNVARNIVDLTADVDGKFVGSTVDGPLGAIGTWALTGTNKFIFLAEEYVSHIVGTFGVELVPEP